MSKPKIPKFPPSFMLLQQEGYLISSCLSVGLTELRAAHVHNKGAFYSALFNLSIGLERLLKAIVIIDFMLNNSLAVPNKKQLQGYGHNIIDLYDTCEAIGIGRNCPLKSRATLHSIDQDLLLLLSDFARVTRYHNLDALSASQAGSDPLARWSAILPQILESDVPKTKKKRILAKAQSVAGAIDDITFTLVHGLDQQQLTTEEALALPELHEQAARFAVLRLVNIFSEIRDLLGAVSHKAHGLGRAVPPFPQMHEFLHWLWNDRQYVLKKKRWP